MALYTAVIDRPMGTAHPRHPDMIYPVNYGYIPGLKAADGDDQDVYVLGVTEPLTAFTGELIAVIRRRNDVEDKWVLAPQGTSMMAEEIMAQVHFQEQYFDSCCVPGDVPVICCRAGEAEEEAALAIRMACLRAVCGYPESYRFPDSFVAATREFLRTADQTTLLTMAEGRPVACATLCYKTYIPTPRHPTGRRAHLMNVYTDPGYRRRGLARRLLTMLHREAETRGVTEITLDATEEGRRLYESMGYAASDEAMYKDMGK